MKSKIIVILLLAISLRLVHINQSLWLDEAIGAVTVKNLPFSDVLINFPKGDNHPPLYYALLDVWGTVFGYSETALRMLSVLFGIISIWFTYKISKLLWNKENVALSAALLMATSQFHVYYSQEARMYIMTAGLAAAAVYYYVKFLKTNSSVALAFFSFSITALIFTDYVPALLLPIFPLYLLLYKKNQFRKFLLSFIPLVLLGFLWLPIFVGQSADGAKFMKALPQWRNIAGGATIKQALLVWTKFTLGRISLADKTFYYSLLVLISIPFIFSLYSYIKRKLTSEEILLLLWLAFPLVTGYLLSFVFPLFIYFRFTYVVPAFYLLMSKGISHYKAPYRNVLMIGLLLVNIIGLSTYFMSPLQQREDWKGAVKFVESTATDQEVILFANPEPFAPYRYYSANNEKASGVLASIKINHEDAYAKTKELTENKTGIYYFEYLDDLMDPTAVIKSTLEEDFNVESVYNFIGVGQVYYYINENSN